MWFILFILRHFYCILYTVKLYVLVFCSLENKNKNTYFSLPILQYAKSPRNSKLLVWFSPQLCHSAFLKIQNLFCTLHIFLKFLHVHIFVFYINILYYMHCCVNFSSYFYFKMFQYWYVLHDVIHLHNHNIPFCKNALSYLVIPPLMNYLGYFQIVSMIRNIASQSSPHDIC